MAQKTAQDVVGEIADMLNNIEQVKGERYRAAMEALINLHSINTIVLHEVEDKKLAALAEDVITGVASIVTELLYDGGDINEGSGKVFYADLKATLRSLIEKKESLG